MHAIPSYSPLVSEVPHYLGGYVHHKDCEIPPQYVFNDLFQHLVDVLLDWFKAQLMGNVHAGDKQVA